MYAIDQVLTDVCLADLFDFAKERGELWDNAFVSLWELFDRAQLGEQLPAQIVVEFKTIQWHPPF